MPNELRSDCPIAASLDVLGDRWTLVVLRDILLGHRRSFSEIGSDEGIATNILADRLDRLPGTGDGAVDTFLREQERSAQPLCPAESKQRLPQGTVVRQRDEAIERGHDDAVFAHAVLPALAPPPRQSGDWGAMPASCHSCGV